MRIILLPRASVSVTSDNRVGQQSRGTVVPAVREAQGSASKAKAERSDQLMGLCSLAAQHKLNVQVPPRALSFPFSCFSRSLPLPLPLRLCRGWLLSLSFSAPLSPSASRSLALLWLAGWIGWRGYTGRRGLVQSGGKSEAASEDLGWGGGSRSGCRTSRRGRWLYRPRSRRREERRGESRRRRARHMRKE
eukprot:3398232-Rhodomonas_salina.1